MNNVISTLHSPFSYCSRALNQNEETEILLENKQSAKAAG
jgi:hypothetical protein